jgi:sugar lactone lactonase YvrE
VKRIFKKVFLILTLFLTTGLFAENLLKNPESVVYDSIRKHYLVSNKGNGQIIKIDQNKVQSVWNEEQQSIRGMHILADKLYVSCNAGVVSFDLNSGKKLNTVEISERKFLNDIASVGKFLYVSDTGAGNVYKINSQDNSYSIFAKGLTQPNGLFHDKDNKRLLLCHWGINSAIKAVSLADATITTLKNTTLSNLDGLAEDNKGNIYVSSWGSNSIYKFDNEFSSDPVKIADGYKGPADISIYNDIIAIPNFNGNKVDFLKLDSTLQK